MKRPSQSDKPTKRNSFYANFLEYKDYYTSEQLKSIKDSINK